MDTGNISKKGKYRKPLKRDRELREIDFEASFAVAESVSERIGGIGGEDFV